MQQERRCGSAATARSPLRHCRLIILLLNSIVYSRMENTLIWRGVTHALTPVTTTTLVVQQRHQPATVLTYSSTFHACFHRSLWHRSHSSCSSAFSSRRSGQLTNNTPITQPRRRAGYCYCSRAFSAPGWDRRLLEVARFAADFWRLLLRLLWRQWRLSSHNIYAAMDLALEIVVSYSASVCCCNC